MKYRLLVAWVAVDVRLLITTVCFVRWCGNAGLRQKQIEKIARNGYAVASAITLLPLHRDSWFVAPFVLAAAISVTWLLGLEPQTERFRIFKLCSTTWIWLRFFSVGLCLAFFCAGLSFSALRGVQDTLPLAALTAYHYLTSIPPIPPKERDSATEKIKEWLRSLTWLPAPATA